MGETRTAAAGAGYENPGGEDPLRRGGRALLGLILPPACAGCGAPGAASCGDCTRVWGSPGPVARGPVGVPVYALARYRGIARRLVLAHKERGRRDLTGALGAALASAAARLPCPATDSGEPRWLVPVPSRPSAARVRGGQHVHALARACAARLADAGEPAGVAPALRLARGARDAVGLDRAERAANLDGRLRFVAEGAPPAGDSVLLLDDVITTGATAGACARTLAAHGVPVLGVLTLAAAG